MPRPLQSDSQPAPLPSPGDSKLPGRGRKLEFLPRSFTRSPEERMRIAAGPPAWMLRRKRMERTMQKLRDDLRAHWDETLPSEWPTRAASWDLSRINREIANFNRFYPIERDLPIDLRSRNFMDSGERWRPMTELDAAWILLEFPAKGAGSRL